MFFSRRSNKRSNKSQSVAASRTATRRRRSLFLEALEDRTLLSTVNWIAGSGNWDLAANWSTGKVPGTGDDAVIDTGTAITVTIKSGDSESVHSLMTGTNDTLSITGGSLTLASTSPLDGPLAMTGGTLTASGTAADVTASGTTTVSSANLSATGGGTLSLPELTSYVSNNNTFQANGRGSVLDVSGLATLTQQSNWNVDATNGGTLKLSSLSSLTSTHGISITDTGNSTLLDGKLTTLTGVTVTLDGTDPHVADSWTSFTTGRLTVTGGSYSLPALTDVDRSSLYVQSGGSLALPKLTNYTSNGNIFQANGAGSVLDVSALATVTQSSYLSIQATNGGEIKLSSLTSLTGVYGSGITDTGGSTILDPNLSSISTTGVTLDGTDLHVADSWTSFTGGSLTFTGGSYSLPALTDVDRSSLYVQSGGSLALPVLTSYTSNNNFFEAAGAGSVLDVSALAAVTQTGYLSVQATNGGEIMMSRLTSLAGVFGSHIADTGGSTILDPKLTSIGTTSVTLDGTDPHVADSWTSFTGGSLTVTGGSSSLPALTDVDRSSLYVQSGGSLALPKLTNYTSNGNIFQANGAGSVLDVSALATVTQSSYLSIQATNGGEIKLSSLTSLTGVYGSGITDTGGSTILDPNLSSISTTGVTLDGTDLHVADSWTSFTGGSLTFTGGSYSLPVLTDVDRSSLYVQSGGSLALPVLTSYTSNNNFFEAAGAGSVLDVSALAAVTQTGYLSVQATNGGEIMMSRLTSLAGVFGSHIADTGGSTILDPKLTSIDTTSVTLDGTDPHVADSLTSFTGGNLTVTAGSLVNFPVLTKGAIALSNGESITIQGTKVGVPADGTSGASLNVPASEGLSITFENTGTYTGTTVNVGQGSTATFVGGKYLGGVTFNVATGATINLVVPGSGHGSDPVFGGTLSGSGGGTILLDGFNYSGGGIAAATGGMILDFPGNMFQWTQGYIFTASGDVTNIGTINLTGSYDDAILADDGTLFNYGTMIQMGTYDLSLHSDNLAPTTLINESGGSYLLESDSGIDNYGGGQVAVQNAGTIRKTMGTGVSTFYINGSLSNTGTVEADSGTVYVEANSITQIDSNGNLLAGTWNALDGATLKFPMGTSITANAANVTLGGSGATIAALSGLTSSSGSFTLSSGASFTTAGEFTNSGSLTIGAGSTLHVAGNFTETAAGALNVQIGGTPASGQFGQIVVTGLASLAGAFNLSLVGGVTPSAGQQYNAITFASGVMGSFASFTGLSPYFTETLTATALALDAFTGFVDLAATSVTAPTTATAGQQITVNWQVTDQSSQAATGSWHDSVYLSPTAAITSSSTLLGAVTHDGGLAANATYSASWTGAVPALPPGFFYVLVQIDSLYQLPDTNRANNALAASNQLQVSVPALTIGTPTSATFTAAGQDQYYQVTVPAGESLLISLASSASAGATALYVSRGSLPTAYNYQQSADAVNQANQTVTVPQVLSAGTYYILAQRVFGAAATAGYTLTATQTSTLTVSSISTDSVGANSSVTVEIYGTGFSPNTTVSLVGQSNTIPATLTFVSPDQIYATFDITNGYFYCRRASFVNIPAGEGHYTLTVTDGAQTATSPTPFTVTYPTGTFSLGAIINISLQLGVASLTPLPLEVTLSLPQEIRSGRTGTAVITYRNPNNYDIPAPLLEVDSTNSKISFSLPDNPGEFTQSAQVLAIGSTALAGTLLAGQSGQITVTIVDDDTIGGDTIPITVSRLAAGQPMDWGDLETTRQPSNISTAAWNVIFNNLPFTQGPGNITPAGDYQQALDDAATYLGSIGTPASQVSDASNLYSFLVAQAEASFPTTTLTSAVDASLPTPGNLPLSIERTFNSSIGGRSTAGIFGLGWTTPWQTSLSADSSGNVTIDFGGSLASFSIEPNGSYLAPDGEYGTLTLSSGVYTYTDASGLQYVFLPNGLLNYEQDINGNRITLGYNTQNQPVALTYSNPSDSSEPTAQLTLTYNAQGFVSQVADGTGDVWSYVYDSSGHLHSVTAPANLTTTYTYDTSSNVETVNALLSITNPDGLEQSFTYDSATGQLTGTSANGGTDPTAYTYPGEGEVVATDAAGNQSTVWFNAFGLPAKVETPRGGVSTYQYDANGNLIGTTDAAGDTYQYSYDASGNLTQTVNPLGQTVRMTNGSLSNLTSITDADGNTTRYSYSAAGNLLDITYPDGTQQSFTYDPLGNLSETVLQNGDPINYQDDANGLVTRESFADGTSQTFIYDAHGNLLTANTYSSSETLTGTTTLTYNAANELLSVTYPNGQFLKFTYNAQGQRTQSVDQDGYTVNYAYDALGRLSELTDGSGDLIVQYTYNDLGQLVNKVNGNGTYTTYAYDGDGNLTGEANYANSSGTTVNSSFTYTYNMLDEETSMTDAAGNETLYGYDATGQLTQITLPGGQTIQYVYNPVGDRTEVINSGTPTTYSSNADNEITQVGSGAGATTYTYDANGNLHTVTDASGTTTYSYNDLNQLVSMTNPDGSVQSFQYSSLGFQVGTTSTSGASTTQTNYLVDPTGLGNVVAAYTGSGSLIADYTYGLGLVRQAGPGGTGYYDFDASGNAVGITGSSGAYVNQYSYLPFGDTTMISAALPNPFTFAGQVGVMQIAGNLFSMRARNYTPATGQFLSNDPIGLAGGDTNTRRYVQNQPVVDVDPTGLAGSAWGALQQALEGGVQLVQNAAGQWVLQNPAGLPSPALQPNPTIVNEFNLAAKAFNEANSFEPLLQGLEIVHGLLGLIEWFEIIHKGMEAYKLSQELGKAYAEKHPIPPPGPIPVLFAKIPYPPGFSGNVNATDPNALVGPFGFGSQNFIQSIGNLSYTVEFATEPASAGFTAAAQDVTITEQMDPNLDWSTFQLGSFGFGPFTVTVPANLTQYQTTLQYQNQDSSPLSVLVSLDFNVQTGLLTATLTSLDPLSGEAPSGVTDGFLYPDNSSHVGEGYVQYTVEPKANLSTGATINQQASVVFDINGAISTNTVSNTIDASGPTSHIGPLPAYSSPSFTVSWTGQDAAGGSGIADYNVYVSDDGGPFMLWQNQTTQTSAVYNGQLGNTYAFYSIAISNVGSMESAPAQAEAQTETAVYQASVSESAHTTTPTAETISTLLGSHYSDPDGSKNTHPGIAVIDTTGTGIWQYSTNGKSWVSIAAVSTTSALLLPQADELRFLPAGLGTAPASLLYVAWDGSTGTAGHYVNAGTTGVGTPFSVNAGELDVTLAAVTQAPVWLASTTTLTPVLPGGANTGETVATAFGNVFSGDNNQSAGIAVVGATSTTAGTWQYALAGSPTQFTAIPKLPTGSAFLLESTDLIRFLPTKSTFVGAVSLTVHAWDGSGSVSDASTVRISKVGSTGGKTPFSSAVLTGKLYFNHAPTENASDVTLPSSAENTVSKAVSVATLLKDASATDADKNPLGLALTSDTGLGTWQYELAGGVWQNVPATLSEASALLLPSTALLRFDPAVNQAGSATLSWLAWDGTEGTNGTDGFAIAGIGSATAFSSTSAGATLTVNASQHPPAWSGSGAALMPVLPNTTTPQGNTVGSIFGSYFEDPSAPSMGIAVSGVTGTKSGQWYYSIDNGTNWIILPSVSASKALLLSANDLIAFVPKTGFLGTATLTAYAWDGSAASGSHGNTVRVHGSDFSSTTLTATCLINTAPTLEP